MHFDPPGTARMESAAQTGKTPQADDRRQRERFRTVFRVAHVTVGEQHGLARIYNLSDNGLALKLHIPVAPEDAVTIRLSEDQMVAGRIVWTNAEGCGVRLDTAIDSGALLSELATQMRSPPRRALRIPVGRPALVRSEKGLCPVTIENISLGGMKVRHDGSLTELMRVKVSLSSGLERHGVVRWSRNGFAGLVLPEPFSAADLGSTKDI